MSNAAFTLESIRVRLSRYQPVLLLAWLAFLCLQIARPCCDVVAFSTPHEHASDHHYDAGPHASLTPTDNPNDAHHSHTTALDIPGAKPQEPAPHCEPLSTPQGDLPVFNPFDKKPDEPKQWVFNSLHRLAALAGVNSVSIRQKRYQVPPTYPPPYLATQRLRI